MECVTARKIKKGRVIEKQLVPTYAKRCVIEQATHFKGIPIA
jgi:hypothetical protein